MSAMADCLSEESLRKLLVWGHAFLSATPTERNHVWVRSPKYSAN